jgi:hypothetical protein
MPDPLLADTVIVHMTGPTHLTNKQLFSMLCVGLTPLLLLLLPPLTDTPAGPVQLPRCHLVRV